jgi:hypothetical protein
MLPPAIDPPPQHWARLIDAVENSVTAIRLRSGAADSPGKRLRRELRREVLIESCSGPWVGFGRKTKRERKRKSSCAILKG